MNEHRQGGQTFSLSSNNPNLNKKKTPDFSGVFRSIFPLKSRTYNPIVPNTLRGSCQPVA